TFHAAYFAPAHGMNPDTLALYKANMLTVTRQVHYSTKNQNCVDLLLALNGIPIATAELKNPMSGQNVEHAKHQYRSDRDPREKLRKEGMIYPRYQQLTCVRNAEVHAKQDGVGNNYLMQHSAGSGKSNSIAWLAHRLASLHDAQDKRVFDSIIVITDRRVLDKQ